MKFLASILNLPDLGKYSDEEFERLVWQAKVRRGDAIWVLPLLAGLLAAAAWGGASLLMKYGMSQSGVPLYGAALLRWGAINAIVAIITAIAVGALVRWVLIVRSVRRLVNKAGCPFCEFSLVGLRVENGWVRCPECGQRVSLHEHRLTEDDLIPEGGWYRPIPGAGPRGAYRDPSERAPKPSATGRTGKPPARAPAARSPRG